MKLLIAALLMFSFSVKAEPLAQLTVEDTRIVLHSEKCAQGGVSNLPRRATWEQGGKVFEGCWGLDQNYGIVRLYFDDRTVVAVPAQLFAKVTGV